MLTTCAWATAAHAELTYGRWRVTGFYQDLINLATASNPNNARMLDGPNSRTTLNLGRQYLDVSVIGNLTDNVDVYAQARFFHDATKSLDTDYRQYQSFPREFKGNGWMARAGGNDFVAELNQFYVDWRAGNLWVRAGKQSIAWGEMVALRVLDIVEPLDLNQMFFFNRAFEEFDEYRIPQWFLRVNYRFDALPGVNTELIVNPGQVVPALLPAQGAPYNVLPNSIRFRDRVSQGQPTVGGRVTGEVGDWAYSLNYITKPDDNGTGLADGLRPDNRGEQLIPDDAQRYRVTINNVHPRINVAGGSLSTPWNGVGAFVRWETTVTTDAPFTKNNRVARRPVWKASMSVDRPTYIIPRQDSLAITATFLATTTFGSQEGIGFDRLVPQLALFFQQPLFRKRIALDFLASIDLDGAVWMQPGVHWEVGQNLRFDAYYNYFDGKDDPGRLGAFKFANGPFFRATYGF